MGGVNNDPCRAMCEVAACDIGLSRSLSWRPGMAEEAERFQDRCTLQRSPSGPHPATQPCTMEDPTQEATMDLKLQEISVVGHRLEGMDNAITSLTAETKSMHLDIAGFQSPVSGLEQRVVTVEDHITASQDRNQELLHVCSELIDLEDRSRRNNVCFLGFSKNIEESLQTQSMDATNPARLQELSVDKQYAQPLTLTPRGTGRHDVDFHPGGTGLERLTKNHNDRGQVLHAVALHTQVSDRDKSHSPLKPITAPT
ncbi:hypothetical protein NDU88_003665 [Pleurodeles waltl]|uniref:Uncharacterized protein n=1 Tax=Pleurodeles waltl TaxID=8319 RepID=A0AAV7WRZ3_PLEWA|nr:hypothetical protein NDU88_003665 [Pleurodeles waltl]